MTKPRKQIKDYKLHGTIDHFRIIGSKNGKNLIIGEAQRYKKPLTFQLHTSKKNPDKTILYAEKGSPFRLQIFTYKNNPELIILTQHGNLITIPTETIPQIINVLQNQIQEE